MKSMCFALIVVTIAMLATAAVAQQDTRPIQLSLVTPIQLFPERYAITGVRFNLLYGRNTAVTGLDVGLINHTIPGPATGIQFGLVGLAEGGFVGWQDNLVNVARVRFQGLQWGAVNYVDGGEGLQWGLVNRAQFLNGLQIGLVNYARRMEGLQIGLVNIIARGGVLPVLPIVNWSFR